MRRSNSDMDADTPAKKHLLLFANFALVFLTCTAAVGRDRDVVILGTATPGGGFPAYGAVFAEVVNRAEPTLDIQPRNTRGSEENVPLLEAGKLDIALVQGEVFHNAVSGIGRPPTNLKIIAAMYSTPGMFAVRGDSPYRSFHDLVGKPVVFGARGSGLVVLARYVCDGIGLDPDRDFKAVYLDRADDGPPIVIDGLAAALWGGGIGWPGFEVLAKSPKGVRFITPDAAEIDRILGRHPFLRRLTIPAKSYPGQNTPLTSVGSWSFVMARPALPDNVAYRLARALHRSEALMGSRLPQARETTAANTLAAAPRLDMVHPGVLRYFRETGLIR